MTGVQLLCPGCGADVGPAVLARHSGTTRRFDGCDRRCEPCGIGFSNGPVPTMIYRDPLHNVPVEVRAGAIDVLKRSLNVGARAKKLKCFGFSTSEDAVTWAVFAWLARERSQALVHLGHRIGLSPTRPPAVHLWGVRISDGGDVPLAGRIRAVLLGLGESATSFTEPDVMLDFGPEGLAIVEVKHRAGNDVQPAENAYKFERYVSGTDAFADADRATQAAHYELTRNWRLGHDLAGPAPFRLVNLGPPSLFELPAKRGLDAFESSLALGDARSFVRLSWPDFLTDLQTATGPLPAWLAGWLTQRGISA